MKLSKQERKRILAELNEIREVLNKQASFKPYPIEYEDEADLNIGIDSVLLDIVEGFGFLGATNVVVKGDKAYVEVEGRIELDVKKADPPWFLDINSVGGEKKVISDIYSAIPNGKKIQEKYRKMSDKDRKTGDWFFEFREKDVANRQWRDSEKDFTFTIIFKYLSDPAEHLLEGLFGGANFPATLMRNYELTGDYRKDISNIGKKISDVILENSSVL